MPVYEYECKNCGQRFDKMQPITAEPLTECINCGEGPIKRVFQPVGVIFKGSGWYINDSRKSTEAKGKSDTKGKSEAKDDGGEAKSEGTSDTTKKDAPAKDAPAGSSASSE